MAEVQVVYTKGGGGRLEGVLVGWETCLLEVTDSPGEVTSTKRHCEDGAACPFKKKQQRSCSFVKLVINCYSVLTVLNLNYIYIPIHIN
jgi:hypothetical protein